MKRIRSKLVMGTTERRELRILQRNFGEIGMKKTNHLRKKNSLKTVLGKVVVYKHFGKPNQEGHESRPF